RKPLKRLIFNKPPVIIETAAPYGIGKTKLASPHSSVWPSDLAALFKVIPLTCLAPPQEPGFSASQLRELWTIRDLRCKIYQRESKSSPIETLCLKSRVPISLPRSQSQQPAISLNPPGFNDLIPFPRIRKLRISAMSGLDALFAIIHSTCSVLYIPRDPQTDQKNTNDLTLDSPYLCRFPWLAQNPAAHTVAHPSPSISNMTSVTGPSRNRSKRMPTAVEYRETSEIYGKLSDSLIKCTCIYSKDIKYVAKKTIVTISTYERVNNQDEKSSNILVVVVILGYVVEYSKRDPSLGDSWIDLICHTTIRTNTTFKIRKTPRDFQCLPLDYGRQLMAITTVVRSIRPIGWSFFIRDGHSIPILDSFAHRSSESYAKFLGQMSTEVLRLSIAIYIVHHVPPGMDAGEFTHQLQRHFSARERRKEQLFGMFQRYQNCRLDIEPVLNSSRENTEKQLAEREFQLQNTLKMLNFKLEFNSDYQTCDSEHSMPNLLRTFAQSVQELFANCYSRRQDLGLINVTDLLGYNSIFYDIKRFIQNWTNLAFSKDCQRCSLSVWLPLIWNSISCGLRSGAEKNVYWRSTNQILLEALGSKVATMEIQKSDQRVITFIHQVVTSLMDTAKCSLENLAETSGQNYTSRVSLRHPIVSFGCWRPTPFVSLHHGVADDVSTSVVLFGKKVKATSWLKAALGIWTEPLQGKWTNHQEVRRRFKRPGWNQEATRRCSLPVYSSVWTVSCRDPKEYRISSWCLISSSKWLNHLGNVNLVDGTFTDIHALTGKRSVLSAEKPDTFNFSAFYMHPKDSLTPLNLCRNSKVLAKLLYSARATRTLTTHHTGQYKSFSPYRIQHVLATIEKSVKLLSAT
ncbi:hypothetical protein CLF_101611, partial [Clonorchis sinensis]